MAVQALFFKTCSLLSNSRSFLNNRVLNVNLLPSVRNLKQETLEKLKLLKIPEKPKKPTTPYVKFIAEHRIKVVKDNPNLKQTDIIRKCAEDWKEVSQELKEKYNAAYKKECVIYDEKILTFNANLTPEQRQALQIVNDEKKSSRQKRKIKKIEKETNKPKRPMGAYALYVQEQSKIRNISNKDLIPSLKVEWEKLSEEEKNKYRSQFLNEKEKYETGMAEWEEKMIKEGRDDLIRVKSRNKQKISRINQLKKDSTQ
ncbi:transcription factor A, mitochondrial-like [Anoplophora glabripennis]|uniref:transcription factor A, mitochondrial-like n=1 Tax=Anoplophora glabripennis TaxID=217634 RepID=UPI0008747228|nr:transcription factor A, mitochondrial-like [Anoplophora glabripennis]